MKGDRRGGWRDTDNVAQRPLFVCERMISNNTFMATKRINKEKNVSM